LNVANEICIITWINEGISKQVIILT
jgi:hypothetical protein